MGLWRFQDYPLQGARAWGSAPGQSVAACSSLGVCGWEVGRLEDPHLLLSPTPGRSSPAVGRVSLAGRSACTGARRPIWPALTSWGSPRAPRTLGLTALWERSTFEAKPRVCCGHVTHQCGVWGTSSATVGSGALSSALRGLGQEPRRTQGRNRGAWA